MNRNLGWRLFAYFVLELGTSPHILPSNALAYAKWMLEPAKGHHVAVQDILSTRQWLPAIFLLKGEGFTKRCLNQNSHISFHRRVVNKTETGVFPIWTIVLSECAKIFRGGQTSNCPRVKGNVILDLLLVEPELVEDFNIPYIYIVVWIHQSWRTCALILLTTALGGCWTVEQPLGSVLEFYPSFRKMMMSIFNCGGIHAATCRKKIYSCNFGSDFVHLNSTLLLEDSGYGILFFNWNFLNSDSWFS